MEKLTPARILVALLLGLAGAEIVWLVQPYNNFVLNNSYIADNYIPELVIGMILVLVLLVNPLLGLGGSVLRLSGRQLALVFGIMLVSVALSQTMRVYPHSLARGNMDACRDKELAEIHEAMDLPPSLYLDPVRYGAEAPVSEQFYDRLEPGNKIPWRAWVPPFFSWGTMVMGAWVMMVGLAMILFPQWKENERLPFPLLAVQQELIEPPEAGRSFPPIFYNKFFWIALSLVLTVHSFNGLSHHSGGMVPKIPTEWNLWMAFSEGLWRHMDGYAKGGRILFVIVGITFFMPNRVGFSLWFAFVACQLYRMIGYEYLAPFQVEAINDVRSGAVLAVGLMILWIGRRQWLNVAIAIFRRPASDEDRRNRAAGLVFLAGCAILFAWLLWAGCHPAWALLFLLVAVMAAIVLARIVCETGLPFLAIYGAGPRYVMALAPGRLLDLTTCYVGGFLDMMLSEGGSRTSATVLAMHALGMDRQAKPRQLIRLGYLFIAVLALGVLLCGITHVAMTYHHSGTVDGLRAPVSDWGSTLVNWVHGDLKTLQRGAWGQAPYNRGAHLLFGLLLGAALQVACLFSPGWPLHPVGLLVVNGWFLGMAWTSIFVGWLLKVLIVKYGGAQGYRLARPLFIGMIAGEVFAAILWALVPVLHVYLLGGDPAEVGRIVIIPQ
jgi:hypothetical protein